MKNKNFIKTNTIGKSNNSNIIIEGDNQLILPLLMEKYAQKIKCIYIDPPYNNNETYNHYHDKQHHDEWLENISTVLALLKGFLTINGSLWISIDDNEMHYLKVLADSIFGRDNFVTTIIWQHRTTRENRKMFSNNHEYILVYAKNITELKRSINRLPITEDIRKRYKNLDNDPRGPWQSITANVQAGHASKNQFYKIESPSGKIHYPPNGRCWIYNKERMNEEIKKNNIWFGKDGNNVPRIKKFIDKNAGLVPETLWLASEVGTTKTAKKRFLKNYPDRLVFDTPKPEELLAKIIKLASNESDYIMDCFLGSGTTVAVAETLNRKYIGIEQNSELIKIIYERLDKLISGHNNPKNGVTFLNYKSD